MLKFLKTSECETDNGYFNILEEYQEKYNYLNTTELMKLISEYCGFPDYSLLSSVYNIDVEGFVIQNLGFCTEVCYKEIEVTVSLVDGKPDLHYQYCESYFTGHGYVYKQVVSDKIKATAKDVAAINLINLPSYLIN